MSDFYHINLKDISLDQYKQKLKQAELIPGRRILKEQIDQRFERLQAQGISNLEDFLSAAKNALLPQPKNLRDFPV